MLRGDVTLLFGKDYTTEGPGSMLEWCGHGPGPATSVKEIFGEKRFKGNDATRDGIRELRDGAAAAFERAAAASAPSASSSSGTKRRTPGSMCTHTDSSALLRRALSVRPTTKFPLCELL